MPPKEQRLTQREFEYVFRAGKRISGKYATYRFVHTDTIGKVGVSVPKKVTTSAVQRNLYRRRIYNVVHPVDGYSFIVIASPGILSATSTQITDEFQEISKLFSAH